MFIQKKSAWSPRRRNVCLRRKKNNNAFGLAMTLTLTSDLEDIFSDVHSHGEYLCQVLFEISSH